MAVTTDSDLSGIGGSGGGPPPPADGDGSLVISGPLVIAAAVGIAPAAVVRQLIKVKSAGGAVTITANPQIAAGTIDAQELIVRGDDNTDYIVLNDGNGLDINGPIILTKNATIYLFWDDTNSVWTETSRR